MTFCNIIIHPIDAAKLTSPGNHNCFVRRFIISSLRLTRSMFLACRCQQAIEGGSIAMLVFLKDWRKTTTFGSNCSICLRCVQPAETGQLDFRVLTSLLDEMMARLAQSDRRYALVA